MLPSANVKYRRPCTGRKEFKRRCYRITNLSTLFNSFVGERRGRTHDMANSAHLPRTPRSWMQLQGRNDPAARARDVYIRGRCSRIFASLTLMVRPPISAWSMACIIVRTSQTHPTTPKPGYDLTPTGPQPIRSYTGQARATQDTVSTRCRQLAACRVRLDWHSAQRPGRQKQRLVYTRQRKAGP